MMRRSSSVIPVSAAGGSRRMDITDGRGGPTVIQRSLLSDVVADVEAEDVAPEGQRCVRVVMREEARC